jgi:thioredoxin-related protein
MKFFSKFLRIIALFLCFYTVNAETNASDIVQNNAEKAALIEKYLV